MPKNKDMIKVVITSGARWNYFQWFILGFYELERKGEIDFKLDLYGFSKFMKLSKNQYINYILQKLRNKFEEDSYNMSGYILFSNGNKKTFTIDSADAPFLFDGKLLQIVDCYFKMQYPMDIADEAFHLTDDINIPWSDYTHINDSIKTLTEVGQRKLLDDILNNNRRKIKPLMIGPRRLARGLSYKEICSGYNNYLNDRLLKKEKKGMCYFGNTQGPKPSIDVVNPDFDWESDIAGYFADKIQHPNEKRAIVADFLKSLGKEYDIRVINQKNSDNGVFKKIGDGYIPLSKFCSHVARFEYNFNVSGYRLSIPNRFMDSFIVGTGVVTDKLSVKWYLPFSEEEVVETTAMGYLPSQKVNWEKFYQDVRNLPKSNPKKIVDCFLKKWEPVTVARYIIRTVENM